MTYYTSYATMDLLRQKRIKTRLIMKAQKTKTTKTLILPKTDYYTLKELFEVNTHFNAHITIRVRHSAEVTNGKTIAIGVITGGKGAPEKVYAKTPVTQTVLEKAKKNGINLIDNADKLVNVISVSTPASTPVTTTTVSATSIASSIK